MEDSDVLAAFDRDEAALTQQLNEARSRVRELRAPADYRAVLDPDLSREAEAEIRRWADRVERLQGGIEALRAERAAHLKRLDREAVEQQMRRIQVLNDKQNDDARELQEALVRAAGKISAMAARSQDILELLDYQSVHPSVLTGEGWIVVDTVHHLRNWDFTRDLAQQELARLLIGRAPGELVANVDGFGTRVEQQWGLWFAHKRQADRKRAEELAATKGAKPVAENKAAAALRVVGA